MASRSCCLLLFVSLAACKSSVVNVTSGAGGATSTTSAGPTKAASVASGTTGANTGPSTSTGGTKPPGECVTDADCNGAKCIELTPGGYKVCAHFPPEATSCTMPPGPVMDQCCKSADCPMGKCYKETDLPQCGGPPSPIYNTCLADNCADDAGCIHNNPDPWICLPAGAFGSPIRQCFTAFCKVSADCTAHAGGICTLILNPCCRP